MTDKEAFDKMVEDMRRAYEKARRRELQDLIDFIQRKIDSMEDVDIRVEPETVPSDEELGLAVRNLFYAAGGSVPDKSVGIWVRRLCSLLKRCE